MSIINEWRDYLCKKSSSKEEERSNAQNSKQQKGKFS